MLVHMVLMEFDDLSNAEETVRRLRAMPEEIDVIRELSTGLNVVESDRRPDGHQWTLGLVLKFDSVEDLKKYQDSDEHKFASHYAQAHRSKSAACSFWE